MPPAGTSVIGLTRSLKLTQVGHVNDEFVVVWRSEMGKRPPEEARMDLPVRPPVEPMLAKAQTRVPDDHGVWSYEPKWDGFLH
jgi:ATP-dependent DNA ligase